MRQALTVLAIWCAGLGAAAQFGKISILYADFAALYAGRTAEAVGLIVSVVGMVGLIFGTTAGLMVERVGPRRAIVAALAMGAAMSALQAQVLPYGLMLLSRLIEGFSHLAIVVVGPMVMAGAASARWRGAAMTLWSSFFGVTYTVLALLAPWRIEGLFLAHALWMAGLALVLAAVLPPDAAPAPRAAGAGGWLGQHLEIYRSPRMAAPAMGFFCYTFLYVALLTLLPVQIPGDWAVWAAAAMPFVSIALSLTLGVWLLSRLAPVRLVQLGYAVAIPGFLGLALVWGQAGAMTFAALWIAGALGLVQGASFAAIPALNPTTEGRARAAGAIAQLGNLGTTTGTPVLAAILAGAGPGGLALIALLACALGIALHRLQARRRQILST